MPLPDAESLRLAVDIYVRHAWPGSLPASVERLCPPPDVDPAAWLMSDVAERTPSDACGLDDVRSFALRIGNSQYSNMKLRISRAPAADAFVFHVDAHDAMLAAPDGSPDAEALAALKAHNANLTRAIQGAWAAAGLLTEHRYLRQALQQHREAIESGEGDH